MKKPPSSPPIAPAAKAAPVPADHGGTPHYGHFGQLASVSSGPAEAAGEYCGFGTDLPEDDSEADRRAAYARHDPRYAGGDRFNLQNESTSE